VKASHGQRPDNLTRRQLLTRAGAVGAAAVASEALSAAPTAWARLASHAASVKPAGSDLGAIDHMIFLMMENRSYDSYFGAYPRGRGFDDHPKHSLGVFAQDYPAGSDVYPKHKLLPFHFNQECQNDPTHDWGPMHLCWDHGKMDHWVKVHTESRYEGAEGTTVMGYYERRNLAFYYALADYFTLGDNYHCSVLGPTHPNRLMQLSGTIDPAGGKGGPIVATNASPAVKWTCTWTTMPEILEEHGVSWKVYNPSNLGVSGKYASLAKDPTWNPGFYDPTSPEVMAVSDQVLPYFKAYELPTSPLYKKAFQQTFPNTFVADVKSGKLPKVSWIIPPLGFDEHPSSSPARGMFFTKLVLEALLSNQEVWGKTALFIMHDENGGFFDHVSPPTPPPHTKGEYLTAKPKGTNSTLGIKGPVGLGVRVPLLVISPFSRGGHIASEVFDHTSQLQLIAKRFGVEVPNVSAWRRHAVGDLSSTLFRSRRDTRMPKLPPIKIPDSGACTSSSQNFEQGGAATPVPKHQRMPKQGGGSTPASRFKH
jgi:phospholipase C